MSVCSTKMLSFSEKRGTDIAIFNSRNRGIELQRLQSLGGGNKCARSGRQHGKEVIPSFNSQKQIHMLRCRIKEAESDMGNLFFFTQTGICKSVLS